MALKSDLGSAIEKSQILIITNQDFFLPLNGTIIHNTGSASHWGNIMSSHLMRLMHLTESKHDQG